MRASVETAQELACAQTWCWNTTWTKPPVHADVIVSHKFIEENVGIQYGIDRSKLWTFLSEKFGQRWRSSRRKASPKIPKLWVVEDGKLVVALPSSHPRPTFNGAIKYPVQQLEASHKGSDSTFTFHFRELLDHQLRNLKHKNPPVPHLVIVSDNDDDKILTYLDGANSQLQQHDQLEITFISSSLVLSAIDEETKRTLTQLKINTLEIERIDIWNCKILTLLLPHIKRVKSERTQLINQLSVASAKGGATRAIQSYDFQKESRFPVKPEARSLPIFKRKTDIIDRINSASCTIITGCTGSGKSTQVPVYLLQDALLHNRPINILVSEPRRIAAMELYKSTMYFLDHWPIPEQRLVGYHFSGRRVNPGAYITYATSGIICKYMLGDSNLSRFSHVILDEVHERQLSTDLILTYLREALHGNTRLVLMSATMDHDTFKTYLEEKVKLVHTVHVAVDRRWNMYTLYEPDILQYNSLVATLRDAHSHEAFTRAILQGVSLRGQKLIPIHRKTTCMHLLHALNVSWTNPQFPRLVQTPPVNRGGILMFFPGIATILEFRAVLQKYNKLVDDRPGMHLLKWHINMLHSELPTEEQQQIHQEVQDGYTRIILSTNIAESSVTLPEVNVVIDFGTEKTSYDDTSRRVGLLEDQWISEDSARQRAGRTARCGDGWVFRMYTMEEGNRFPPFRTPEIQRKSHQDTIMDVMGVNRTPLTTHQILNACLDAPSPVDVKIAEEDLLAFGFLIPATNSHEQYQLTHMGKFCQNVSGDWLASYLVINGVRLQMVHEAVVLSAVMSSRSSLRSIKDDTQLAYYAKRLALSARANPCQRSDIIADVEAFREWVAHRVQAYVPPDEEPYLCQTEQEPWVPPYSLMKDICLKVIKTYDHLYNFGLIDVHPLKHVYDDHRYAPGSTTRVKPLSHPHSGDEYGDLHHWDILEKPGFGNPQPDVATARMDAESNSSNESALEAEYPQDFSTGNQRELVGVMQENASTDLESELLYTQLTEIDPLLPALWNNVLSHLNNNMYTTLAYNVCLTAVLYPNLCTRICEGSSMVAADSIFQMKYITPQDVVVEENSLLENINQVRDWNNVQRSLLLDDNVLDCLGQNINVNIIAMICHQCVMPPDAQHVQARRNHMLPLMCTTSQHDETAVLKFVHLVQCLFDRSGCFEEDPYGGGSKYNFRPIHDRFTSISMTLWPPRVVRKICILRQMLQQELNFSYKEKRTGHHRKHLNCRLRPLISIPYSVVKASLQRSDEDHHPPVFCNSCLDQFAPSAPPGFLPSPVQLQRDTTETEEVVLMLDPDAMKRTWAALIREGSDFAETALHLTSISAQDDRTCTAFTRAYEYFTFECENCFDITFDDDSQLEDGAAVDSHLDMPPRIQQNDDFCDPFYIPELVDRLKATDHDDEDEALAEVAQQLLRKLEDPKYNEESDNQEPVEMPAVEETEDSADTDTAPTDLEQLLEGGVESSDAIEEEDENNNHELDIESFLPQAVPIKSLDDSDDLGLAPLFNGVKQQSDVDAEEDDGAMEAFNGLKWARAVCLQENAKVETIRPTMLQHLSQQLWGNAQKYRLYNQDAQDMLHKGYKWCKRTFIESKPDKVAKEMAQKITWYAYQWLNTAVHMDPPDNQSSSSQATESWDGLFVPHIVKCKYATSSVRYPKLVCMDLFCGSGNSLYWMQHMVAPIITDVGLDWMAYAFEKDSTVHACTVHNLRLIKDEACVSLAENISNCDYATGLKTLQNVGTVADDDFLLFVLDPPWSTALGSDTIVMDLTKTSPSIPSILHTIMRTFPRQAVGRRIVVAIHIFAGRTKYKLKKSDQEMLKQDRQHLEKIARPIKHFFPSNSFVVERYRGTPTQAFILGILDPSEWCR